MFREFCGQTVLSLAHAVGLTWCYREGRACAVGDLSPYSHGLLLAGTESCPPYLASKANQIPTQENQKQKIKGQVSKVEALAYTRHVEGARVEGRANAAVDQADGVVGASAVRRGRPGVDQRPPLTGQH